MSRHDHTPRSNRRRYLITYDISDDKRRLNVFKNLHNWGDRIQFSVFLCECTKTEIIRLTSQLEDCINQAEDQILFIDMGNEGRSIAQNLSSIGKVFKPPTRVLVV